MKVRSYKIWCLNRTFHLMGHFHMRNEVRISPKLGVAGRQTKDIFEVPEDLSFEEFYLLDIQWCSPKLKLMNLVCCRIYFSHRAHREHREEISYYYFKTL